MTLPIKTTVEDVRAIVGYLKTKPAGATIPEARAVISAVHLDPRKLTAYVTWDLVGVDGERYKLTDRGRRFSRSVESEPDVLREVVNSIPTYRSSVEWAFHQGLTDITVDDLAANWHDHHHDALGTDNESTIKAAVTCFFNVAAGAQLGVYTIGRGGQPTRLTIARGMVERLIQDGPSAPPWIDPAIEIDTPETAEGQASQSQASATPAEEPQREVEPDAVVTQKEPELRVFISHGKNMEIVDQVKTTLEIANIHSEIAVEEESTAIPVPDKVFGAMRNCNAGIIVVSVEPGSEDTPNTALNQNVLIEIGAAFVLYDKRVVLLWDKRIPVPSNLQGLYRCEYEGDELSWSTGMKLMKAVQGFKSA